MYFMRSAIRDLILMEWMIWAGLWKVWRRTYRDNWIIHTETMRETRSKRARLQRVWLTPNPDAIGTA